MANTGTRLHLLCVVDLLHQHLLATPPQHGQVCWRGICGHLGHLHHHVVPVPVPRLLLCHVQEAGAQGPPPGYQRIGGDEGREGADCWRGPQAPVDYARRCPQRRCDGHVGEWYAQRTGYPQPQGISDGDHGGVCRGASLSRQRRLGRRSFAHGRLAKRSHQRGRAPGTLFLLRYGRKGPAVLILVVIAMFGAGRFGRAPCYDKSM